MRVILELAECLSKLQLQHVSLPCSWAPQCRDDCEGEAMRCPRLYCTKFSCSLRNSHLVSGCYARSLHFCTSYIKVGRTGVQSRRGSGTNSFPPLPLHCESVLHDKNHLWTNMKVFLQYRKHCRSLFFQIFTVECITFLLKPCAFLLKSSPPSSV